jgi:hypothetical protein
MDWQTVAVAVAVILALVYVGRRSARAWKGRSAGCGGCKCQSTSKTHDGGVAVTMIPCEQLTLSRRTGGVK